MATHIPLDQIADNPFQSRTTYDADTVRSLADEMQAEGYWAGSLQGRRTKNGKIELVFGHRRLRALRLLKTATVPVEIVDLTDAQMALRSLEENLQREGLTDLEKADAVKRAVEIAREELRAAGKSDSHAVQQVASRLGLGVQWVAKLCAISESMDSKIRKPIEAGYVTAKTAMAAKEWGGVEYVKTLAQQGKVAAETGDVPKPTHMTVQAMAKVVRQAPEAVQEKLKSAIVAGDVTTPVEAQQKGRRLAAERTKRNKLPPPDLHEVIIDWTHRIKEWDEQMKHVAPYMEYLEGVPEIAGRFRAALAHFIETAQQLLEDEPAAPRTVGRGQTSAAKARR
jgi:ParB/RepB/Spo0J family partition protein